jgi:hypothetical protein
MDALNKNPIGEAMYDDNFSEKIQNLKLQIGQQQESLRIKRQCQKSM